MFSFISVKACFFRKTIVFPDRVYFRRRSQKAAAFFCCIADFSCKWGILKKYAFLETEAGILLFLPLRQHHGKGLICRYGLYFAELSGISRRGSTDLLPAAEQNPMGMAADCQPSVLSDL